MGNLEEEIGRQRQSELAEANSDIQREASINPSADLRRGDRRLPGKGGPSDRRIPHG